MLQVMDDPSAFQARLWRLSRYSWNPSGCEASLRLPINKRTSTQSVEAIESDTGEVFAREV